MSRSWAKLDTPEVSSFDKIMSEEIAKESVKHQKNIEQNKYVEPDIDFPLDGIDFESCDNDEMIAKLLQMQFDKEYDEHLKRTEDKYNGASKVSISFDNYRRAPQSFDFESDSEEEEVQDIRERKNWDRFDELTKQMNSIPACGYKLVDGNMITKHDVTMNGRKNACKLLSFPPEFQTGDGEDIDLKLSNKVFNSLKRHSQLEQAKRHKIKDKKEDEATAEFGLDEFTSKLLLKLVEQEWLERINGVVSIGKESVIFHAEANPDTERNLPTDCILKIFKTTLSEFKQRDKYIRDDYRFKDRMGKQTARKTINLWAEKEMHNLHRLKNAGILCPDVITIKKHVLVMSMIGCDHTPASKLKDAKMRIADYIIAYDQIVNIMKVLFQEANLIHADLSEYNILWHNNNCYIIDVGQAVMPSHKGAEEFLRRDCKNITDFFTKKDVPKMMTEQELFDHISDGYFEKRLKGSNGLKLKPHTIDKYAESIDNEIDFNIAWNQTQELKVEPAPLP